MIEELDRYSDDQLWAVVHQRMAEVDETRLYELIAIGKAGRISDDEKVELERLINQVDEYMLLRSQAFLLLKQRGYNVP